MYRTYLWRRRATPSWLASHEGDLDDLTSGAHVVIERPGRKSLVAEAICKTAPAAKKLVRTFGGSFAVLPRDWLKRCLRSHARKPIRVGRRLVVVDRDPGKQKSKSPRQVLIIPAGAAFGTGDHVTTAMCLRLLENTTRAWADGWSMFDAGTGSGILALAGSSFGAGSVIGLDNDPLAISTAIQNALTNKIRGVRFFKANALTEKFSGKFEILAGNLYCQLLVQALPHWKRLLKKEGRMILSGVLRVEERELVRALKLNGLTALKIRRRGKWIALVATLKRAVGGARLRRD